VRGGRPFLRLHLRGATGEILWGYRPAAWLTSWTIRRGRDAWVLAGTTNRIDAFQVRQKPLYFTAPRDKGRWCWPVVSLVVEGNRIQGVLGPPDN